jgi:hypothetical protein
MAPTFFAQALFPLSKLNFSGKTIFLLVFIVASAVLIPFLNQNQIGMAQLQNNQT